MEEFLEECYRFDIAVRPEALVEGCTRLLKGTISIATGVNVDNDLITRFGLKSMNNKKTVHMTVHTKNVYQYFMRNN